MNLWDGLSSFGQQNIYIVYSGTLEVKLQEVAGTLSEDSHDIKYNSAVEEIIPGDERLHSPVKLPEPLPYEAEISYSH